MGNERPTRTEEERKQALEDALRRIRPVVESRTNKASVHDRLARIANKPDEPTKTVKKSSEKPLTLEGLAEKIRANEQKSKEIGLTVGKDPRSSADEKDKNKNKEKDKEKENSPERQEQKMKEMFSKIKLPSGMEIHQEGPQWVLVSKDGKQRTDVTDVMNTIDKFNRDVDTANNENRLQNETQSHVDRAAEVGKKDARLEASNTDGKVQMVSEALPLVRDVDNNQVFDPKDVKAVAEAALSFSDEKRKLEALRDPKSLEEMQERDKKNQEKEEEKKKDIAREVLARQQEHQR